jgi:hypothetical protein
VTLRILGGMALLAAGIAVFLEFDRLRRLGRWAAGQSITVLRAWSVVAAVFGVFLWYAVAIEWF